MVPSRPSGDPGGMATLHIEHPITDFETWRTAFDAAAPLREQGGVRGHVVRRPVDDPRFVVVDLDFATVEAAAAFREILRTRVWAIPANSPALAGEPVARVLQDEGAPSS